MVKYLSFFVTIMCFMILQSNGQIQSPCTPSIIGTLTPCMNFLTNSTANGVTSPISTCCNQLRSLTSYGKDCLCLIVTGGVPFQIPSNTINAISLPRACNMAGVPLQCKASAAPIPAAGPSAFVPTMSPALTPDVSPSDPKQISPSEMDQPAEVDVPPTSSPRVRPVTNPSDSAADPSNTCSHYFMVPTFVLLVMFLKPY